MIEKRHPQAGDLVRLTSEWSGVPAGRLGVIGGALKADMSIETGSITFGAYSVFRDDHVVACSGGPGTIGGIPTVNLRWTGETQERRFWRWKDDFPGAGRSEPYSAQVAVWEWDGLRVECD